MPNAPYQDQKDHDFINRVSVEYAKASHALGKVKDIIDEYMNKRIEEKTNEQDKNSVL